MARYQASVETQRSVEEVFAYLSDFSTTAQWDPGIERAEKLTPGRIEPGTKFRVTSKTMGRELAFVYRVIEYDAPHSICLIGESGGIVSRDRMEFEPTGPGTRVTYDAEVSLKGILKLGEPLLRLGFKRVGDRALDGLKRKLASPGALA